MNPKDLIESIRIPIFLTIAIWLVVFLMMLGVEAIWYLDDQLVSSIFLTWIAYS